tara:strand:- start:557 stop:928 length:372 start_codon:yes stop_codon:yes gene_type:complete
MVSPLLQQPISELTRWYAEQGKDARRKRRKEREEQGDKWRNTWKEVYNWLANEQTPDVTGPLVIGMRLAPRLTAPVYLGSKLAKGFATAASEGAFGSGPTAGLEYTPEIAEYERTALGSSRLI